MKYAVRIFPLKPEDGGGYGVDAPDLPGCFTDGDTPEEALVNIKETIKDWLEIAKLDKRTIPKPKFATDYLKKQRS